MEILNNGMMQMICEGFGYEKSNWLRHIVRGIVNTK
jgi:hypothetical protein